MTLIERNPDIDLDTETVPKGMQLVEGKHLMPTARSAKVPFGIATSVNQASRRPRPQTVGLIIKNSDIKKFNAAVAKKIAKNATCPSTGKKGNDQ
jgi:hypothetical protein